MEQPKIFLTVPEMAVLLGVSKVRAYQLVAESGIPTIRLSPRRIRIPMAAFQHWLEVRTHEGSYSQPTQENGD